MSRSCNSRVGVYHESMVSFFEHGLAGVTLESQLVRSWWRPGLRSFGGFKDFDEFPTFAGAEKAYVAALGAERSDELICGVLSSARAELHDDLFESLGGKLNDDLFDLYAPAERQPKYSPDGQTLISLDHVSIYVAVGATKIGTSVRRLEGYSRSIRAITQAAWWGFRFPFATGSDELDAWISEASDAAEEFSLPATVREEHLWRARLELRMQQEKLPWSQLLIADTLLNRPLSEKLSQEEFDSALSDAALTY